MKLIFFAYFGYGLGQLYEILKQPTNALYHYQQAHKCRLIVSNRKHHNYSLRPADSRILIALGVISSKLGRKSDAEKCFKKAFQVGDVEGNALIHLAKYGIIIKTNAKVLDLID